MAGKILIDSKTRVLGLLGNPSRHSLSPFIHNYFLYHYKINSIYLTFEPALHKIKEAFESAKNLGFAGLNITMPFKEQVFKLVDKTEGAAKIIKAVNTVKFEYGKKDGHVSTGFSTDGDGVLKSLEDAGFIWDKKICLIIGAGGAAKSAVLSLIKKPIKSIYLFDIIFEKAEGLAKIITSNIPETTGKIKVHAMINEIGKLYDSVDLIINCSPAGMHIENSGKNEKNIPVPATWNLKGKYVFDMVYNPQNTGFLKKARTDGAKSVIGGLDLLVNQAAFSFKIWSGIMPESKIITEVKKKMSVFLI